MATKTPIIEGPPFCSGNFHIGHAVNQTAKDYWIRLNQLRNPNIGISPFVFDAQGLPTQGATIKRIGTRPSDPWAWISACKQTADFNAKAMLQDLKRLQVLPERIADDRMFLTTSVDYKLSIMNKLVQFWKRGDIYSALRPSAYCTSCSSTLANAQIECKKDPEARIHVLSFDIVGRPQKMLVATTQPETYVNSEGIAVSHGPYHVYEYRGGLYISKNSFHPDASRKYTIDPVGLKFYRDGREYPIYFAPDVHTTENETGNVLTDIGGVITSPSHTNKDLINHERYDPDIRKTLVDTWALCRERYLQEVKLRTFEKISLFSVDDCERIVDCCWRCGKKVVTLLQEDWFLKTESVREKLVEGLDHLIKGNKIVGLDTMGDRIRKWWSTPHDWVISRNKDFLTPLPLARCPRGCPQIRPITLSREDVVDELELYHPTIGVAMARNRANDCACGAKCVPLGLGVTVWLDSGALPAYLGHHASMLIEGKDQDVGWFYSVAVFNLLCGLQIPFDRLHFGGWAIDNSGAKISKSKIAQEGQTVIGGLVKKYGSRQLRSYLLCCSTNKDFVYDERQLFNERKYANLAHNISKYLESLPESAYSNDKLLKLVGDDPIWHSDGRKLTTELDRVLESGQIRKNWLFLRDYALQTYSRKIIKTHDRRSSSTSKVAGLILTGRLLLCLLDAGLGVINRNAVFYSTN